MKHSELQKHPRANARVACSGKSLCIDCRHVRKQNKRRNNKTIRRLNQQIIRMEALT